MRTRVGCYRRMVDETYCQRRAQQERLAAETAGDARARRCHEQLALMHSSAPHAAHYAAEENGEAPRPGLIILTRV